VALELDGPPSVEPSLVHYQSYLQARAPIDVVIPFVRVLADQIALQATAPRLLRDFQRLRALIKAVAITRIAQRKIDLAGRVLATVDDYATVHRLAADMYAATIGVSDRVRVVVEGIAKLTADRPGATCTKSEVADHLGLPVPTAWARINQALRAGYVVNDENRPRQKALLRLGDPLPSTSGLPDPDVIAAAWATVEAENAKTGGERVPLAHDLRPDDLTGGVFAFSPSTAGDKVDSIEELDGPIEEEYSRSAWDIDESDDELVDAGWDPTRPAEPPVDGYGFPFFE
jgi:hypothetical protein